ncbi:MAG: glycosyltransferase [Anaerolineae bacterium]
MQVGINGFFWGREETGSGQYLRGLVRGLTSLEADLRCTLIAPRNGPLPGDMKRYPVRLPRLGRNLSKLWFEQLTFSATCRRLQADIAHVPYYAAPLFSSVPMVVTVHDLIPLILGEYRGGPLVRAYIRLVSAAARRAQALISDSESTRQDILARLGVPQERVNVVPLAVDDRLAETLVLRTKWKVVSQVPLSKDSRFISTVSKHFRQRHLLGSHQRASHDGVPHASAA